MFGRRSFQAPARSVVQDTAGCRRLGFTLIELLVVLTVIALLVAVLLPSLSEVKAQARLAACAVQMRAVSVGLNHYTASRRNRLPGFAFSDYLGNLPLSGHWGGMSQSGDPDCFSRHAVENVNLGRLVADGLVARRHLICPGAECSPDDPTKSYFPYSSKFSTYCLRMLYSEDIFDQVPKLANWSGLGLLGIYIEAGSGFPFPVGKDLVTVPYLRTDVSYREIDPDTDQARTVNWVDVPVMADTFWYQDYSKPPVPKTGLIAYEVRAGWCHAEKFNVLYGNGAVRTLRDDGTVAANCLTQPGAIADDGAYFASYAIKVWRHFEDSR